MRKAIAFFLVLLAGVGQLMAQCPMCKASVESNLENGSQEVVGMGLNSGILYLMVIPYIMVVVIGVFWYRARKKQERNAPQLS